MTNSPNWSVRIAIALPIVMVVAVALSIYLPTRHQNYQGQFLYTASDGSYYGLQEYTVANEHVAYKPLTEEQLKFSGGRRGTTHLYLHDISTNESNEVSFEQATQLTLDNARKSQTGLTIEYGTRDHGFMPLLFGSGTDFGALYVAGDRGSKKLNLKAPPYPYYGGFNFLGWVKS
jgi:hypothetical protein